VQIPEAAIEILLRKSSFPSKNRYSLLPFSSSLPPFFSVLCSTLQIWGDEKKTRENSPKFTSEDLISEPVRFLIPPFRRSKKKKRRANKVSSYTSAWDEVAPCLCECALQSVRSFNRFPFSSAIIEQEMIVPVAERFSFASAFYRRRGFHDDQYRYRE